LRTLKKISGKDRVKILCNKFGFMVKRQSGSHVILRKETQSGAVETVVPNHQELKIETLKGILKLARVSEEEFALHQ
jgi:predicted RNA binding protein YcfA (HicA-like mRNA interferase family)